MHVEIAGVDTSEVIEAESGVSISILRTVPHPSIHAHVSHPYSMPREHFDVFYCRGLRGSLKQMWPMVKNWH
jgi:hypothetical protein